MKRFLVLGILVLVMAACTAPYAGDGEQGSGKLVSRSFDLAGFSKIEANSAAQIEVTRGEAFSVVVQVDDNLEPKLDVQVVRGDTLRIQLKTGFYRNHTLRAQVTMPELTGISLNGASRLSATLAGEAASLDLNGASRATLSGTAGRVNLVVNGASQALLGDLEAGDIQLDVNGAGHARVQSSGSVRGKVNGASTVTVTGSPTTVDVRAEGGSHVITE